ncbi:hypothetical protein BC835DRAFT_1312763 [Cytidiella melzeri]|nr:hypothetical protein BC835DRAFT_1312763 [Cytidiella melzeri]
MQANGPSGSSEPPKQRRKPGRVPVSCAECRRLKLRCDRQVPCEKCVKRGCSAICPDGALTTGNKMNRLAFADADDLQKKVEGLRDRVRELEDALATLQSNISDNPHPLLRGSPAVDSVTGSSVPPNNYAPDVPSSRDDEEFIDAFGTLTLGLRGESRFFGPTSRSEYLIHAPQGYTLPPCTLADLPRLTPQLFEEALKQWEIVCDDPELKRQALQALPSLSEACRLCDLFLEYGEYLWEAIPRTQLYDEILSVIYRSSQSDPNLSSQTVSSHAASLLFIIFALATALDPKSEPYAFPGLEYYLLARLCLRFDSPVYETTLWSIQSLIYQTLFLQLYDKEPAHTASHKAWILNGYTIKLGHSIGLHVKSSKWQLDEEASNRRAHVFWQLFHKDAWLSFGFGRPPGISLAFVDCDFPKDPEEILHPDGNRDWGFHPWSWQYSKLLHDVMTTVFGVKAPQYSTVLELDKRIRDFPIPWRLRSQCDQLDINPEPAINMQKWMVLSSKEITLLNLHRPYFAQVLSATPHDLLKHRYSPSVIAIYRAAWRLIEGLIYTHQRVPLVIERVTLPWSQALSAAIVMCLLVTRAPASSLASASLHELDRLCEMFEKLQKVSLIARNNLGAVRKMQRQAHDVINKIDVHDKTNPAFTELDRIGGKTQLISRAPASAPSPGSSSTASTPSSTFTSTSSVPSSFYDPVSNGACNGREIHPVIINDMRTFEGFSTNSSNSSAALPMDFDFDLSQAFPLPANNIQTADLQVQDISRYLGLDLFAAGNVNTMPASDLVMLPDTSFDDVPNTTSGMTVPVPELHATWQSFVEQLGFKF